ncbi:hypothetical protein ABZ769_31070 [Streptomyces olivoreticuli]
MRIATSKSRLLATVAAGSALTFVLSGTAHADRPDVYVQQLATGHCLTFNNGGMYAGSCNNGLANSFYEKELGNDYVQYVYNGQGNTCLGMNSNNNDTVGSWPCDAGYESVWWRDRRSGGIGAKLWNQFSMIAKRADQCLDAGPDGRLVTAGCNDGGYQRWSARDR